MTQVQHDSRSYVTPTLRCFWLGGYLLHVDTASATRMANGFCTGRFTMVDCLLVDRIDLLRGTLDLIILQTLRWGPQRGHGIGQAIRASSQNVIQVEHGSLYPAPHRLERRGWLAAEWRISGSSRRAGTTS
jgi:hypothetical protein